MISNKHKSLTLYRFYNRSVLKIACFFLLFSTVQALAATTKTFQVDTSSVLRNPCVGWGIYCEGWEFERTVRERFPSVNPENFWKQMDEIAAHEYSTHIYIRILWSALEPEEGKYAWIHNAEFIRFIEEARMRNLKLSFRIYFSTKSRSEEGTPKYVFDAGAPYRWDSGKRYGIEYRVRKAYPDHPIWLDKFESFIKAFAKEYDDPDITDFIDGFGAGWWGEGHHINLMDEDNLPVLIDQLTGIYYRNFKNILTVYNLARRHPDPTIVSDFELARELVYEERGFLPRRDGLGSHWFSRGDRDMMQYYFFPDKPLIGEGCYWLNNPVDETESWYTNDTRFAMNSWPEALEKGLDDALNFHANTFDLRVPREARLWIEEMPEQVQRFITNGGYRILPAKIVFPDKATAGGELMISHTWKNLGVGLLPNNHPNWDQKYKIAFALIDPQDKRVVSQSVLEGPNPGTWIRGRDYTYDSRIKVSSDNDSLLLAVSIFDTRKDQPGLELSVQEKSNDKWYSVGMICVSDNDEIESDTVEKKPDSAEKRNLYEAVTDGATITFDPNIPEELRIRGGLPNFFARLETKDTVRIAYLGGSITKANGWRPNIIDWFASRYPDVKFIEINAAISGTGSDYGACRITTDVMARNPDLVFLEHRVNGGAGFEARSVEGIIRQIWQHNAQTDICFIYTVSQDMLPTIQSGRTPWFGMIMESIANVYNIPSIDLGVEIAKLEKAAELVMTSNYPVAGKLWFSTDGVHPGEAGHELYTNIITRSMIRMEIIAEVKDHQIPAAMDQNNWEETSLLPITKAELSPGWKIVNNQTDTIYREDFKRSHAMLRGALKCNQAGEFVKIKWSGTTLGFSDIPYGKGLKVQVSVDGSDPIIIERVQREKSKYARFFYLPEQAPGEHTAVLQVAECPEGLEYYIGQLLIIGTVLQ